MEDNFFKYAKGIFFEKIKHRAVQYRVQYWCTFVNQICLHQIFAEIQIIKLAAVIPEGGKSAKRFRKILNATRRQENDDRLNGKIKTFRNG